MTDTLEEHFSVVLGDHFHDCATVEIEAPNGDFSLQLATGTDDVEPVWNVASYPPAEPPDDFDVIDSGTGYTTMFAKAQSPAEAAVEARRIAESIGGDGATLTPTSTFRMGKGSLTETLRDMVKGLKLRLSGGVP